MSVRNLSPHITRDINRSVCEIVWHVFISPMVPYRYKTSTASRYGTPVSCYNFEYKNGKLFEYLLRTIWKLNWIMPSMPLFVLLFHTIMVKLFYVSPIPWYWSDSGCWNSTWEWPDFATIILSKMLQQAFWHQPHESTREMVDFVYFSRNWFCATSRLTTEDNGNYHCLP